MRKNLTKEADDLGEDNRILWLGILMLPFLFAALFIWG
jgi:hypothetical protein